MATRKRKRRFRRRLQNVVVLPTFVTLLNGLFGFSALLFAARGISLSVEADTTRPELNYFGWSAWMIFLAMVADGLDGFVARKSGGTSFFGGQLDSLSDALSFGAAPAFLMLQLVESSLADMVSPISPFFGNFMGRLLWVAGAIYVCCALLRLARFNVENSPEEASHMHFDGLPTPAAAGVIASLVLLYTEINLEFQSEIPRMAQTASDVIIYALPFISVLLGLVMVSTIPYVHMVNRYLRGRKSFGKFLVLMFVSLALILKLQLTLAVCTVAYIFTGPVNLIWRKLYRKSSHSSQINGDNESPKD